MALIEAKKIEGASVYGVEQVCYTVDGVVGQDYVQALTVACFKESVAVEAELDVLNAMVRARQQKLKDLGDVMTVLTKAQGTMPSKDQYRSDLSEEMDELLDAAELGLKYFVRIPLTGDNGNQVRRDVCQNAIANVKHSVDMESNSLQQDVVTLQNLVGKRDSTYQTAASVTKKALSAGASAIRSMRG